MLNISIVGCGGIATEKYIPAFQKLTKRVKVVGLCDLNETQLEKAAQKIKTARPFTKFQELLSKVRSDITVICTPPAVHSTIAIEAIQNGAHVLIEKPMALSVEECNKINEIASKCNKKVGIMHNQIFNPAFLKALQIMAVGKIGNFLSMRILLVTHLDDFTVHKDHWVHKLPGGVIGETGPHAVYLSLMFLNEIQDINVICRKQFHEYPWSIGEDIKIDLIADNGISSIDLIYGGKQTAADVDIICSDGILKIDLQSRTLILHDRPQKGAVVVGKSETSAVYQRTLSLLKNVMRYAFSGGVDPHYIGIKSYLDYIEEKSDYFATGEKGKAVVDVMERIVKKLKNRN